MRARIPRYLHLPIQLLWFDIEDIGLMLSLYALYLIVDSVWVLGLLVVVPWAFKLIKAEQPRGFLRHLLYRYGFAKLPGYPSPQIRVFWE